MMVATYSPEKLKLMDIFCSYGIPSNDIYATESDCSVVHPARLTAVHTYTAAYTATNARMEYWRFF